MTTTRALCWMGLALAACGQPGPSDQGPVELVEARTVLTATPLPTPHRQTTDMPAEARAVAELLGARHPSDLPDRSVLDAHIDADQSLAWLARHGHTARVRVHATAALGLYPERDHTALLVELAGPASPHPSLRAAALRAWSTRHVDLRRTHLQVVRDGLRHDDDRVKRGAIAAAAGLTELRADMERLTSSSDDRIRELATRTLEAR